MKSTSAKALGFLIAVMMLGGAVLPTAAHAVTLSELIELFIALDIIPADKAAQARTVLSQQEGSTPATTSAVCPYTWTRNLTTGSTGNDVMKLQEFLNSSADTRIAASGVGSAGSETTYFGSLTANAVAKFQDKYASEVLTPIGLTSGTGYFGTMTRAKANELCATASSGTTGTTGSGTTVVTPAGTGLTVSKAANQPSNSLAPNGAARVPFTRVNLTAGTDGAVTVNSIVIERTSLGSDAAFAGVVLLDENGTQLGIAKTLNSQHQATVGTPITIPAGATRTFTIAGNMASSLTSYAGEVPSLSVIGVNTSAAVSGSLPITGAAHTINATLSIGTATVAVSSFDPDTSSTKEVGTTDFTFAGFRITAGSGEKLRLNGVSFNQAGSVSAGDLANVKVFVDGNSYPVTISGDTYAVSFPGGILIDKGFSKDVYVKGDIVGANSAGRSVVFDIDEATDISVVGELYGYGITVTAPTTAAGVTTDSQFTTGTPFFDASHIDVSAGSATSIGKANSVAAQNVAINVENQPLGGFETEFTGEPVTVQQMDFGVTITGGANGSDLTSVSLVDENGSVVAGPVDGTASGIGTNGYIRFTDSVTFPVGKKTYTLKGKLSTDFSNGDTVIASSSPANNWTNPKGDITGDTIDLSGNGLFSMNTMTVKAAALDISVSGSPAAQNITAGVQDFTFANYQFDASQSGEDVRFSSIPLDLDVTTMAATEVTGCQLFDSGNALNTGSNVVNPSAEGDTITFTFDQSLTVPKGTVKTLALKCDIATTVSDGDTLQWGYNSTADPVVTGVTSSQAVTETETTSAGQLMTLASGSVTVSKDSSSPSYTIVASGSTGVTAGVMKFRATNEDVTLQRVGLQLSGGTASSTDLTMVSIWDGSTKVGEATFVGNNINATSTLFGTGLVLPKDTDKLLTVRVDLANIGSSDVGTQGVLIKVDVDTNGTNTQGVGASGTTINATGTTAFDGIRMFRSIPTVTKLSVPSNTLQTGTGVEHDLYRFSISASSGGNGIGLAELTPNVITSSPSAVSGTTTIANLKIFAYTDASFSTPVSGFTNGQIISTLSSVSSGDNTVALSSILQIPAGQTYYFKVTGETTTTAGTGTFSGSVTTRLSGDAAYPDVNFMGTSTSDIADDTNDDFIWSPNATSTSEAGHDDWTNGYFISGLPSAGTDGETISK